MRHAEEITLLSHVRVVLYLHFLYRPHCGEGLWSLGMKLQIFRIGAVPLNYARVGVESPRQEPLNRLLRQHRNPHPQ